MTDKAAPRQWSLAARLGWRLAAVMLAAILLAAAAMAWRAIETVHEIDDSALQDQARLIAARLPTSVDGSGRVNLPEGLVAPFTASDGDNIFMVFADNRLVATSDAEAATQLLPLLSHPLRPEFLRLPGMPGHKHGMVGLTADTGPWQVVVLQGREQTAVLISSLAGNFLVASLWLLVPIGAATTLVGVLTLRRGLRPLREVSAAAALVGPAQPAARLPLATLPVEVAPLVYAVNQALTRMEQALIVQRRFMADAAHSLRTPLAVLTARLDMLDEHSTPGELRHDVDRMARLVGQLLRMARLEGAPLDVTQCVDLHAVAVEAITDLVPLALQGGVDIALLEGPLDIFVRGNHTALVLAVTNLIENALSYAPARSAVEVAVTRPASIAVTDRGPGVALAHRRRIFERFERGPAPHEGGAGLGLAIVAEIANAHGGTVQVTEGAGGGAAFVLLLEGAVKAAGFAYNQAAPLQPAVAERL